MSSTDSDPSGSPQRDILYSSVEGWTAEVRGMTQGDSVFPMPGTPLAQEVAQRTGLSYADCVDFCNTLAEILTANNVTNRVRYTVLDVGESHSVVEYYDPYLSRWNIADPTFGLVYFDAASGQGQSVEDLSGLVQSKSFDNIHELFVVPEGDSLFVSFPVDPATMFLNPIPAGQWNPNPVNDPRTFMQTLELTDAKGLGGNYVFGFSNSTDSLSLEINKWGIFTQQTVVPAQPWLLSGVATLQPEWYVNNAPPSLVVYTFPLYSIPKTLLISPADGVTDVDAAVPVQFIWRPVAAAQNYELSIGSSPGGNDIAFSGHTQATQFTASLDPQKTYYARLQTQYEGKWQYRDSTLQTGTGLAHIISPPNGANGTDASQPIQFSWNAVSDATLYGLWLGASPGAADIYQNTAIQGTGISLTLSQATTYYARVWTQKSANWYYTDSTFSTAP